MAGTRGASVDARKGNSAGIRQGSLRRRARPAGKETGIGNAVRCRPDGMSRPQAKRALLPRHSSRPAGGLTVRLGRLPQAEILAWRGMRAVRRGRAAGAETALARRSR